MTKLQEFVYRKMFHLSKADMMDEPLEDIAINFKINQYIMKKQEAENAMMEEKAKASQRKE